MSPCQADWPVRYTVPLFDVVGPARDQYWKRKRQVFDASAETDRGSRWFGEVQGTVCEAWRCLVSGPEDHATRNGSLDSKGQLSGEGRVEQIVSSSAAVEGKARASGDLKGARISALGVMWSFSLAEPAVRST